MAPPLGSKRPPLPDPPDVGNRVSKLNSATSKSKPSVLKGRSSTRIVGALQRSLEIEQERCATQDLDKEYNENHKEHDVQETLTQSTAASNYDDEFPCSEGIENQSENQNISENVKLTQNEGSKFQFMEKIKGLLEINKRNPSIEILGLPSFQDLH